MWLTATDEVAQKLRQSGSKSACRWLTVADFCSYWMADGGADVAKLMQKLGTRMKKWHVNDRGHAGSGPYMTPILDQDATELGNGNMDLEGLYEIAAANGVDTIVLETHRNWINGDPIQSIQNSGAYMQEHFN